MQNSYKLKNTLCIDTHTVVSTKTKPFGLTQRLCGKKKLQWVTQTEAKYCVPKLTFSSPPGEIDVHLRYAQTHTRSALAHIHACVHLQLLIINQGRAIIFSPLSFSRSLTLHQSVISPTTVWRTKMTEALNNEWLITISKATGDRSTRMAPFGL